MKGVLLTGAAKVMGKEPDVAGALAAMRDGKGGGRGRGRRSGLYDWLFARFEHLSKAFEETPPAWKALAVYLAEHGIKGADDRPPTAVMTRSAWVRVVQAKQKRQAKKPVAPAAKPLQQPVIAPDTSAPMSDRDAARARFRANFKPISIPKRDA